MIKQGCVFFATMAFLLGMGCGGAFAAALGGATTGTSSVKCVKLNSSATCYQSTITDYSRDWSAKCNNYAIQGIADCGSVEDSLNPPAVGEYATAVQHDDESYNDTGCWCRMTTPAVSRWVFAADFELDEDGCYAGCAQKCSEMTGSVTFKSSLFGSMQ